MAIQNFGPGRCANLIKLMVTAWPWEATEKGYDWWVGLCQHIDWEGDVKDDITLQDKSYTDYSFERAREAADEIGRLVLSTTGDFRGLLNEAEIILRRVSDMAGGMSLDDSRFNKARERAAGGSNGIDVSRAVAEVSDFEGYGDVLAAYFFIHQAKQTRQLPPPAATTAAAPELDVGAIQQLLQVLVAGAREGVVTQAELPELVRQHSQIGIAQVEVNLKGGTQVLLEDGPYHERFPLVLQCIAARQNVALIGPAGSGKTTMAEQVAKALGLNFFFSGAIQSEYKLLGFIDANSGYKRTTFREAYEHGGVFLFDEIDASSPQTLLAFNAALANGVADFPDGMVRRHKDFVAIAAGNTFWSGRDRVYVGRNQLDAASMDRFVFIEMGYDHALERNLAGNSTWVDYVQGARKAAAELGIRHVISPRASLAGSKLFDQGIDGEVVAQLTLWKGLPETEVTKIKAKMPNKGAIPRLLVRERTEDPAATVKRVSTAQRGVNLLAAVA